MGDEHTTSDEAALALWLAEKLGETGTGQLKQIQLIIDTCGVEFVKNVYLETFEVEANGGLKISIGSRRRTMGGVFFYLCYKHATPEQRLIIHQAPWMSRKGVEEKEDSLGYLAFEWEKRAEVLQNLLANKGDATKVQIILTGRPAQIERRKGLIITLISDASKQGTLPTGLPPLPEKKTLYTVYISSKQWAIGRIDKLLGNPDTLLVIQGIPSVDPLIEGIAIYTLQITTKLMHHKKTQEEVESGK